MYFYVDKKFQIKCFLISVLCALGVYKIISNEVYKMVINDLLIYPTKSMVANFLLLFFIALIPLTFLHESLHVIAYRLFKGKAKIGFSYIFAYSEEISSKEFTREEFLTILLFPIVFLSLVSLFISEPLGGMVFASNLIGSSADLYMAFFLARQKSELKYIDRKCGFEIVYKM